MEAKRNRRFQFSLRSLLIVVTLFCAAVWLATIGVSYGTAEVVASTIIACVPFLVVVCSFIEMLVAANACPEGAIIGTSRRFLISNRLG